MTCRCESYFNYVCPSCRAQEKTVSVNDYMHQDVSPPTEALPEPLSRLLADAFRIAGEASREIRRRKDAEVAERRAKREMTRRAAVHLIHDAVELLHAAPSKPVNLDALLKRLRENATRDNNPIGPALHRGEEVLEIARGMLSTPAARAAGLVLSDSVMLSVVAAPPSAK